MNGSIVFVAGGLWQRPFVEYLKGKGHFLAIVNPVATVTTALGDYHIRADVNDLAEIERHFERLRPAFITSDQSDISTLAVARLSEKWNLPGNGVEVIRKFTDKFAMYEFARSAGIPVPETREVACAADVRDFAAEHGFPVIIKPTDGTMSRGFRKLDGFAEITDEVFASSLRFSKAGRVIAQEFVPGYMVVLDGVCSGGRHRTLTSSRKDDYFKPGINSGLRYPSELPDALLADIVATNDRYVEGSGMKFGLTHSEYIIHGNAYRLIEIGARGGGAGITDKIVPWVSGVNTYDVLYASLRGETIDVKGLRLHRRPALLKYYRAEDVAGCDERKAELIRRLPGVADFQFDFIGKQYVSDGNDSRHSMGIYLAESEAGIERILGEVDAVIQSQGMGSIPRSLRAETSPS